MKLARSHAEGNAFNGKTGQTSFPRLVADRLPTAMMTAATM
jgi:hypothetical protein